MRAACAGPGCAEAEAAPRGVGRGQSCTGWCSALRLGRGPCQGFPRPNGKQTPGLWVLTAAAVRSPLVLGFLAERRTAESPLGLPVGPARWYGGVSPGAQMQALWHLPCEVQLYWDAASVCGFARLPSRYLGTSSSPENWQELPWEGKQALPVVPPGYDFRGRARPLCPGMTR